MDKTQGKDRAVTKGKEEIMCRKKKRDRRVTRGNEVCEVGGFTFETIRGREFFQLILMGDLWVKLIKNSGQDLDRATKRCMRDPDGLCAKRGCIQGELAGRIMDIYKLAEIQEKVIGYVKRHPHWDRSLGRGADDRPAVIYMVAQLNEGLRKLIKKGEKETILLDEGHDCHAHECPRFLPEGDCLNARVLDYDKSAQMYKSGEWRQRVEDFKQNLRNQQGNPCVFLVLKYGPRDSQSDMCGENGI